MSKELSKKDDGDISELRLLKREVNILEKKVIPDYIQQNEDSIRHFITINSGVPFRGIMKACGVSYSNLESYTVSIEPVLYIAF
jgi:hypothetical protein